MISEWLFTDNDNKRKEDHTIFLEATSIIEIWFAFVYFKSFFHDLKVVFFFNMNKDFTVYN